MREADVDRDDAANAGCLVQLAFKKPTVKQLGAGLGQPDEEFLAPSVKRLRSDQRFNDEARVENDPRRHRDLRIFEGVDRPD